MLHVRPATLVFCLYQDWQDDWIFRNSFFTSSPKSDNPAPPDIDDFLPHASRLRRTRRTP
jgi:hypothetical protein